MLLSCMDLNISLGLINISNPSLWAAPILGCQTKHHQSLNRGFQKISVHWVKHFQMWEPKDNGSPKFLTMYILNQLFCFCSNPASFSIARWINLFFWLPNWFWTEKHQQNKLSRQVLEVMFLPNGLKSKYFCNWSCLELYCKRNRVYLPESNPLSKSLEVYICNHAVDTARRRKRPFQCHQITKWDKKEQTSKPR